MKIRDGVICFSAGKRWYIVAAAAAAFFAFGAAMAELSWYRDFDNYYDAGRILRARGDPYRGVMLGEEYQYSPFFATLMTPLSLLTQKAAAAAWFVVNAAFFFLLVSFSAYLMTPRPEGWGRWLVGRWRSFSAGEVGIITPGVIIITMPYWLVSFHMGQANHVIFGLAAAAVYADARGRQLPAGVFMGVAAALKPTAAVTLPYFLLRRRFGTLAATAVAFAAALAAPALYVGWPRLMELTTTWWEKILQPAPAGGELLAFVRNQSLPAALYRLCFGLPAGPLRGLLLRHLFAISAVLAVILAAFVVCFYVIGRRRAATGTARGDVDNLALSFVTVAGLLLTPFNWMHYYVGAFFAYMTAVRQTARLAPGAFRTVCVGLLAASVLAGFATNDIFGARYEAVVFTFRLGAAAMVSLLAAVAVLAVRSSFLSRAGG